MIACVWIRTSKIINFEQLDREIQSSSCVHRFALATCITHYQWYMFETEHHIPKSIGLVCTKAPIDSSCRGAWNTRSLMPERPPASIKLPSTMKILLSPNGANVPLLLGRRPASQRLLMTMSPSPLPLVPSNGFHAQKRHASYIDGGPSSVRTPQF